MRKIILLIMFITISSICIAEDATKKQSENPYMGLRNMMLSYKPHDLGLDLPKNRIVVFGLAVEWLQSGAVVTVSAFQTGDASIYFSNGGGYIGGSWVNEISNAAKNLVKISAEYLNLAKKYDDLSLPQGADVKFYFFTNAGLHIAEDSMENKYSKLIPLFNESQEIITQFRINEEEKSKETQQNKK